MTDVNFIVNVQSKGVEVVEKLGNEIENAKKQSEAMVQTNRKLSQSNETTEKSVKRLDKAFESIKEGTEKTNAAFSKLGIGIAISIAGAVTTITTQLKELTAALKEQTTQADQLKVSFEQYQGLMKLAKDNGLETGQVYDQIWDLSQRISEAIKRDSGPAAEALKELGVTAGSFIGLDAIERTQKFVDSLKNLSTEQANFIKDEMGIKDISPVLNQLDQINAKTQELRQQGILFSELEVERLKNFSQDMSDTFNLWNSLLGKIAISTIPAINTVFKKTKEESEGVTEEIGTMQKSAIILSNLLAGLANVVGVAWNAIVGGFKIAWEIIEDIGGLIIKIGQGIVMEFTRAFGSAFNTIVGWLSGIVEWFQRFARRIGWDSLADSMDGFTKKLKKFANDRVEAEKKANLQIIEDRKKFNIDFQKLSEEGNKEVQQAVKETTTKVSSSMKDVEQNLINMGNPTGAVAPTADEQRAMVEKEAADIYNRYASVFAEKTEYDMRQLAVQAEKSKKEQTETVNRLKQELNTLKVQRELYENKDYVNGITKQEYAKRAQEIVDEIAKAQTNTTATDSILEKMKGLNNGEVLTAEFTAGLKEFAGKQNDEVAKIITEKGAKEVGARVTDLQRTLTDTSDTLKKTLGSDVDANATRLQAELDKANIRKSILEDEFKVIQKIKDETAAGIYGTDIDGEVKGLNLQIKALEEIIKKNLDTEITLRAQVQLRQTQLDLEKKQEEQAKKLYDQENQITRLRIEELKSRNQLDEAFALESQLRLKEIEKSFEKTGNMAEALELEKKLINVDKVKLELDKVKKEIESTQDSLDNARFTGFGDLFDNQAKMNSLKEKEIELNKTLGIQSKELTNAFTVTNKYIIDVFMKSFDSVGEGIGRVMAGTKSMGEEAREQAAVILGELNKIAIRYAVSGLIDVFGKGVVGNTTSGITGAFLSGISTNHVGRVLSADHTSGRNGLASDEVLFKGQVGETIIPKNATPLLQKLLSMGSGSGSGNGGVALAYVDSTQRESIIRDKQSQQTLYKIGMQNGWDK